MMNSPPPSATNLDRLREKVKKDSLAVRLVDAQNGAKPGTEAVALKQVIVDRLAELRKKYAGTADHQG
jgi:hypothetical protein